MKFLTNKWVIIVVILAVVAAIAAFSLRGKEKQQYFTADVTKGDIASVVEATGTINAVTSVQVGSQVSGTIQALNVDFNSRVKKGQVIARLDPSLFEGALSQAKADLANAEANVAAAKANLAKAQAAAVQAKQDFDRTAGLAKEGVMSQQQLDAARATYDAAVAQVSANRAAEQQADAQVQQRKAAVQVAQTNLNHTVITAPIDGTVVNRAVDVGQTVAASLQAPTLFTIAQDLTKMLVYAKTDESDVGQIKPGQKVTFTVDAFPKDKFSGVVSQVRMNATTVQNVVTYDTIVEFDNPDMKLFPGMTAYISIPVAEAFNATRVPNGALRYRPDNAQELLAANGMSSGGGNHQQGANSAASGSNAGAPSGGATPAAPAQGAQATDNGGQRGGGRFSGGGARGQGGPNGGRMGAGTEGGTPGGGAPNASAPAGSTQGGGAQGGRGGRADVATVWKLAADNQLKPVRLKIGITDHTTTEVVKVLAGELSDGDKLVIGSARGSSAQAGGSRPGMPGAPGGGGGRGPGR